METFQSLGVTGLGSDEARSTDGGVEPITAAGVAAVAVMVTLGGMIAASFAAGYSAGAAAAQGGR